MRLDGRGRDHQVLGDLRVAHALRDEHEDLPLARRQRGDPGVLVDLPAAAVGQVGGEHLQHAPRHAGGDDGLAARHGADRLGQLGRPGVLEQEPAGAGAQARERVLVQVEGGQDQDLRGGALSGDGRRRINAVHAGHAHIHEDDAGAQRTRLGQGRGAVGGLADDLNAVLGVENHAEAHAHERLVVGQHHRDRRIPGSFGGGVHSGSCHGEVPSSSSSQRRTARTRHPVAVGPAWTEPP